MRSPQHHPAAVLGVPRVRAVRPTPAPATLPEPELEIDVELAPEPQRLPIFTPPTAFALPTPPASYVPPMLTASEGVALPRRLMTFGVATFSFSLLAVVIATFGGNDPRTLGGAGTSQEPRAGYTRPNVEKLSTGAMPQPEATLPNAAPESLGMMRVKPAFRPITITRVATAAAPAETTRRATVIAVPPAAATADDIPMEREPVQAKPKVVRVAAAPSARPEPKSSSSESGMAQRALDEARHEDTSLSGH